MANFVFCYSRAGLFSRVATMSGTEAKVTRLLRLKGHLNGQNIITRNMSGENLTTLEAREVLATRKSVPVLDSKISFLDTGLGDNVVIFLHGNPTAAYLWRNIIPHVRPYARCLAPDLIGMGHSGKEPNNSYRFVDHFKYLSKWIDVMDLPTGRRLSFVIHDWGSALGFHWANLNRDRIQSIIFMEGIISTIPKWDVFPDVARKMFQAFRSPAGEELVLKKNFFVERMLPGAVLREMSDEEMDEYRMPYKEEGESRRPTLTWPREIPIEGDPADVTALVDDYHRWITTDPTLPKLYIDSEPGFFSAALRNAVSKWPNHQKVTVKGSHFLQEDSPRDIGVAIAEFLVKDVYKK